MNPNQDRKSVPIPECMAHLEKDRRGYPIPVNVMRDKYGEPHFTINDEEVADVLRRRGLCAITGKPLIDKFGQANMWFVGGVASAFHTKGAYFDSPMKKQAATYALKVCPFLAMPSYVKRIDGKTLQRAEKGLEGKTDDKVIVVDHTQTVDRPSVFVLARAKGYQISYVKTASSPYGVPHLHPSRPFETVEFWRDGVEITAQEAWDICEAEVAAGKVRWTMEDLIFWPDKLIPGKHRQTLLTNRARALRGDPRSAVPYFPVEVTRL